MTNDRETTSVDTEPIFPVTLYWRAQLCQCPLGQTAAFLLLASNHQRGAMAVDRDYAWLGRNAAQCIQC